MACQQRAAVALRAVRPADEQPQARDFIVGEEARAWLSARNGVDVLVKARWPELDPSLVCGDPLPMLTNTRVTSSRCASVSGLHADAASRSVTGPPDRGTCERSGSAPKIC